MIYANSLSRLSFLAHYPPILFNKAGFLAAQYSSPIHLIKSLDNG